MKIFSTWSKFNVGYQVAGSFIFTFNVKDHTSDKLWIAIITNVSYSWKIKATFAVGNWWIIPFKRKKKIMSSLQDTPQAPENGSGNSDSTTCTRGSRRYTMALLLFLLLIIEQCRDISVLLTLFMTSFGVGRHQNSLTLFMTVVSDERAGTKYNSIGEWTLLEIDRISKVLSGVMVIAQIPGAILIFKYSSHKYLIISVVISSILHMLTPLGLHHHSVALVILLITERAISASIRTAVIDVWKDWAPPSERTKLVMICFLDYFAYCATAAFLQLNFQYFVEEECYYLTGIAGLVWALFWYCASSNIPENDPLISENELRYPENTLPSDTHQEIRLRDVPWKNILCSKQVLMLCLIFCKTAYSFQTIITGGLFYRLHLPFTYDTSRLFFCFSFALVLVPLGSARLADKLLNKYRDEGPSIRLKFLCGGLFLQCLFTFGTLSSSELVSGVFFMLAYLSFAASLSGFITMPLDLSPRYVSIILGCTFTAFSIGTLGHEYFRENVVKILYLPKVRWLFLLDGIMTFVCGYLFFFFADYKEQPWSTIPNAGTYQMKTLQENEGSLSKMPEEV